MTEEARQQIKAATNDRCLTLWLALKLHRTSRHQASLFERCPTRAVWPALEARISVSTPQPFGG